MPKSRDPDLRKCLCVLIRKKKVDSFKAASSQNPYIRTNWFVHTAVTTEISMHII